jgi:hypothetical protein
VVGRQLISVGVTFAAGGYVDTDDRSSFLAAIEVTLSYSLPLLILAGAALYAQRLRQAG